MKNEINFLLQDFVELLINNNEKGFDFLKSTFSIFAVHIWPI